MNTCIKDYKKLIKVITVLLLIALLLAGCSPYKNSRYIELGEYKNLKLDNNLIEPTDEDLMNEINLLLDKYAEVLVFNEGEVHLNDIANIDYSGVIDGKPFEGGAGSGYDLTIGSNSFIPGFEEGLIGAVIGKSITLNLTFPADYKDEDNNISKYAGKDVSFKVEINKVTRRVPPEYNDEFIQSLDNGYNSISEYNEFLKKEIYNYKKTQTAWQIVVDNTIVKKYPSTVQKRVNAVREYYEYNMAYYGYTSFNEFCIDALGQTEEEFNETNLKSAQDGVKQEMISQAIAMLEDIKLSSKELNDGYDNYAEYYGYDSTEDFLKDYDKESITSSILLNKVMEFVALNCIVIN